MELTAIYACLCDRTRLRILHLLTSGPLCVCHFQTLLNEPQVKISKHLNYLKSHGLVKAERQGNWRVYSLPSPLSLELRTNLACLKACAKADSELRKDAGRLEKLTAAITDSSPICCISKSGKARKKLVGS